MPDDVKNAIEQNAQGPNMARGDSVEVRQHALEDQVKADKYLSANQGARKRFGGIRIAKLSAPGTVY